MSAQRKAGKVAENPTEENLPEIIAQFFYDPEGFVYFIFPWGETDVGLGQHAGPDKWQTDVLQQLGKELQQGADAGEAAARSIRMAVRSGHGIGKTALVSWIILWFMSTRPHPQVVVTANTKQQLENKTWRELAKWHKRALNAGWFKWTATRFYHVEHPDTWFASAVPWSKENSEAFAGTHEEHVLILFDEASAIEDVIWDVAEGAMTTEGAMWLAFGNPTRGSGRFRECFRAHRHRWTGMRVDSRDARMANKAEINDWVETYGEDSDFVRVRVKGEFPRVSSTQFIGEDLLYRAADNPPEEDEYQHAAKVLSLDIARFGDDASVALLRQGRKIHGIWRWREVDTHHLAWELIALINEHTPDATFLEEVGIGVGVMDTLKANGYEVQGIIPQKASSRPREHANKRMEMWAEVKDWLKNGGCPLVDGEWDDELFYDLTAPEYGFDGQGRMQLERKKDMKARGLPSPDTGDALALGFAWPVLGPEQVMSPVEQKKLEIFKGMSRGSWMSR
jgi:hypothetical protein